MFIPPSLTVDTTSISLAHARGCGCAGCRNNNDKDQEENRDVSEDIAAADSIATANSMEIGDTFNGTLSPAGDTDWIALELEANQGVAISMEGITLSDSFLWLYDSNGEVITYNDDRGFLDYDSLIEYTAYSDQTVYIRADSYENAGAGSYSISVTELAPPPVGGSGLDVLETITWGPALFDPAVNDNIISVYFAPSGAVFDGITSEGLNAYERGQFQLVFDAIEALIDVEFTTVQSSSAADLIMVGDSNEIDFLGYFNAPGEANEGVGVFGTDSWDRSAGGDLSVGGYGHQTIIHEILHGLGMAHPHDTGGTSTIMSGVGAAFEDIGDYGLNQGVYTVMTYNSGFWAGPLGTRAPLEGDWGFSDGPMALDIAVLQEMYGANETTNSGDTVYDLVNTNEIGTYWTSIWDTGGTDEIRYRGGRDTQIDLQEATLEDNTGGGGYLSNAEGITGGYTIAAGAVIENASSGTGNDQLIGNAAANNLSSGGGNDRIFGNNGNDTISGGFGNDSLFGGNGNDRILGGFNNDRMVGAAGADTLVGDNGDDVAIGGFGRDVVYLGNGNDTFVDNGQGGFFGVDRVFGGDGNDSLSAGGGNDRVFGGTGNDTMGGGNGNDLILGASGNDRIWAGNGNDNVEGGFGRDIVNLGAGNDTFNDVGQGGFLGADIVNGGAGNDNITMGGGNDTVTGGADVDSFNFVGANIGANVITDFTIDGYESSDVLIFDRAVLGANTDDITYQEIVDQFVNVQNGNVVFDFGGGNSITLQGMNDVDDLEFDGVDGFFVFNFI